MYAGRRRGGCWWRVEGKTHDRRRIGFQEPCVTRGGVAMEVAEVVEVA